jgi:hypothetical protein
MPQKKIGSKTGNAPVKKQGHTSSGSFGDSPSKQAKWGRNPKDLKIK